MVAYFAFLGTIYLLILVYQDYKNFMNIDDRFNYFMLGIAVSLISHIRRGILYMLMLILTILVLNYLMRKIKAFGVGDINTISWIFLGFGIINITYIIFFWLIFSIITGLYLALKYWLFRYKNPSQFYPVILITFIITCFSLKIY